MFSKNLKRIRQGKHLSLNALSRKANLSVPYLSDLENSKKENPSRDTIRKIAEALDVSESDLFIDATIDDKLEIAHKRDKILFSKTNKFNNNDFEKVLDYIDLIKSKRGYDD